MVVVSYESVRYWPRSYIFCLLFFLNMKNHVIWRHFNYFVTLAFNGRNEFDHFNHFGYPKWSISTSCIVLTKNSQAALREFWDLLISWAVQVRYFRLVLSRRSILSAKKSHWSKVVLLKRKFCLVILCCFEYALGDWLKKLFLYSDIRRGRWLDE